jgi:hypothetical protein
MRRKKKVAKNKAAEKALPPVEAELALLDSIGRRISTLQGAKLGAEGLMNVLNFLAEEADASTGFDARSTFFGLSEVAQLLFTSLRRETDAMECTVWDWKKAIAPEAPAPAPGLKGAEAAAGISQDQLAELVRLQAAVEEAERPIRQALKAGADVQPGAFRAMLGLGLKHGQVEVL